MSALRTIVLDDQGRPLRSILVDQGPARARMTGYRVGDGIRGTLVRAKGPEQGKCQQCGGTIRHGGNGWSHLDVVRHKAQP